MDETLADAKYLWRRIESAGQEEISQRDLHYICKGKFKTVAEMEPALNRLVEMGYVKTTTRGAGQRGRPAKILTINPWDKNHKNHKNRGS